jgi:hypothetical protein
MGFFTASFQTWVSSWLISPFKRLAKPTKLQGHKEGVMHRSPFRQVGVVLDGLKFWDAKKTLLGVFSRKLCWD